MTKKHFDRTLSVLAVVLWMAAIFWFSAQNGQSSGSMSAKVIEAVAAFFDPDFHTLTPAEQAAIINSWQLFVRKAAHFSEYALLGLLASNALRSFGVRNRLRLLVAPVFCLIYAVSDELHQYFVPDRACRALDVLIDSAGGLTGAAVFFAASWWLCRRRLKKDKQNTP